MESLNLMEVTQRLVLELADELQGALLYLDAGAAEIAQTTLGVQMLLGLGALHLCSLESASPEDAVLPLLTSGDSPKHLVVLTTQLLTDTHRRVLHAVLSHPGASRVSLYCSVSEHAHAVAAATDLGVEAYREYAALLQDEVMRARSRQQHERHGARPGTDVAPVGDQEAWSHAAAAGGSGLLPLHVRVSHLPLQAVCLDPGLFVLPAACAAAKKAVAGNLAAGFGPADPPSESSALGEGASGGLSLMAAALLSLAAQLGLGRPEVFAMGPVSSALAVEIASLPFTGPSGSSAPASAGGGGGGGPSSSGSQPPPPQSLALLLLDRGLDLAAPALHTDHPWDVLATATAARQAAAAVAEAAEGAAASGAGRQHRQPGHPGGPRRPLDATVSWRPVDLRLDLPGATPVPLGLPPGPHPLGCELLDPTDRAAVGRVEGVAGRGRKEGLAALRRGLKEALRAERLAPAVRSKAGAVQAPELRGLAECLLDTPGAGLRHRGTAGLGLGAADAMAGPAAEGWEAAAGLERSVLAALTAADGGGGEAAVQVLLDALAAAQHSHGLLHVGHVLEVLPAVYSAAPDSAAAGPSGGGDAGAPRLPFGPRQQAELRSALEGALLGCPRPLEALGGRLPAELVAALEARQQGLLQGHPSDSGADAPLRASLSRCLDALFQALGYAAGARSRLRDLTKVTHTDVFAENLGSVNPLLRQVVRKALQRADITDWAPASCLGSSSGLVRGLLGGLMGGARALVGGGIMGGGPGGAAAHPGDFGVLLVFVVGGISWQEVREVRSEVDNHVGSPKPRVLLGGTSLLLPQDVVAQLAAMPS